MKRGKIKIVNYDKIKVVTTINGEETVDRFTFDEILKFIKKRKKNK